MMHLTDHPNIYISGQLIFRETIQIFGFKDEALWKSAADNYEESIKALFNKINLSTTGRAVLREIDRLSPRTMKIIPMLYTDLIEPDNGDPYELPIADAERKKKDKEWGDPSAGRRRDTVIYFTPAHWKPSEITSALTILRYNSGPGTEADEVLLHEVIHGMRAMAGFWMWRNVPFQKDYDTFEEFFAILICNIYRSELGRTDLRRDHDGFNTLASIGIKNQMDFYNYRMNKFHLRKLRNQQPLLFADLKLVKALFNPTTLVDSK